MVVGEGAWQVHAQPTEPTHREKRDAQGQACDNGDQQLRMGTSGTQALRARPIIQKGARSRRAIGIGAC
jgi:hypothetical protein